MKRSRKKNTEKHTEFEGNKPGWGNGREEKGGNGRGEKKEKKNDESKEKNVGRESNYEF